MFGTVFSTVPVTFLQQFTRQPINRYFWMPNHKLQQMQFCFRTVLFASVLLLSFEASAQQYFFNFHKHFAMDGFTGKYEMLSSESEHIIGTVSVSPRGEGSIKLIQGGSSTTWNVETRTAEAGSGNRVYKVNRGGKEAVATLASGGLYLTIIGEEFKEVYSRTDIVPDDKPKAANNSSSVTSTTILKNADDEAFVIVEQMPEFPGGEHAMQAFMQEHFEYPEEAEDAGIEGTVYLNFVIEKDGSISNVKVVRGIGGGCEEEAIRVVGLMPNWIPGKQRGKLVRVSYNFPVKFKI